MRHVTDDERRARLAARHALAPGFQVETPEAVTRAMTVLHATEAATVYLSCWARCPSLEVEDVHHALYVERSLVKQLAMRRTLFVFPRDLLPAVWGSASARVAGTERATIAKDAVTAALAVDGHDWLDRARAGVIAALADEPAGLTAREVREAVPLINVKVAVTAGASWAASRVITQLGATADVVRAANTGHWRTSRPRWTLMRHWLDHLPPAWSAAEGYREILRRWLQTFGPGTEDDLVWWLGSTNAVVRAALADLEAVEVSVDHDRTGWLLPDDLAEVVDPGPWVALLPVLDPTVMGWRERTFYLGPHRDQLFDRNGNAGTTVCRRPRRRLLGAGRGRGGRAASGGIGVAQARRALDAQAARLTTWLGGVRISPVYQSRP